MFIFHTLAAFAAKALLLSTLAKLGHDKRPAHLPPLPTSGWPALVQPGGHCILHCGRSVHRLCHTHCLEVDCLWEVNEIVSSLSFFSPLTFRGFVFPLMVLFSALRFFPLMSPLRFFSLVVCFPPCAEKWGKSPSQTQCIYTNIERGMILARLLAKWWQISAPPDFPPLPQGAS